MCVEQPTRSVRQHPFDGGELLILSGDSHKTGQDDDTEHHYRALDEFVRERFAVRCVDYRWSTQDHITVDQVPWRHVAAQRRESVRGQARAQRLPRVVQGLIDRATARAETFGEHVDRNVIENDRGEYSALLRRQDIRGRDVDGVDELRQIRGANAICRCRGEELRPSVGLDGYVAVAPWLCV